MLNSEAFLNTFVAVETWLRKLVAADRSLPFYQAVERASEKSAAVRRYRDDLKQFADLRNVIVHERRDGRVLAEPNDATVGDFARIHSLLTKPPALLPKFQRRVQTREIQESVGVAVSDMRQGAFSQLPVLHSGKVVALLTSETVVRWLASEINNDLVSLLDTKIEAVLLHTEDTDHYEFVSGRTTVHEALSAFEDFASRGKDLDAILVTASGKRDEALQGILTVYDLPEILQTLGLRHVSAVV